MTNLETVEWPPEFRAEMLGEYTERQGAQQRLLLFAVAAVIGIFLLLQASFRSWRRATATAPPAPPALARPGRARTGRDRGRARPGAGKGQHREAERRRDFRVQMPDASRALSARHERHE